MENAEYGRRGEGRWTPIRAKVQDTRANPNSWETYLVRKRWDIGLLRALSLRVMMMMMMMMMMIMMMMRKIRMMGMMMMMRMRIMMMMMMMMMMIIFRENQAQGAILFTGVEYSH